VDRSVGGKNLMILTPDLAEELSNTTYAIACTSATTLYKAVIINWISLQGPN
jgi:hypothetical protein